MQTANWNGINRRHVRPKYVVNYIQDNSSYGPLDSPPTDGLPTAVAALIEHLRMARFACVGKLVQAGWTPPAATEAVDRLYRELRARRDAAALEADDREVMLLLAM